MNETRNSITKRRYRRQLERIYAERRRRRIVRRRMVAAILILLAFIGIIIFTVTAAGADSDGIDTSRGVIYFTDEPAPNGPIAGATAEMVKIWQQAQESTRTVAKAHSVSLSDDPAAGGMPKIIETELTAYEIPDDYKAQGGYLPLDLQWHILDLLISYGIEDEYPTAIAIYEQESGYQPDQTGKHGDKGGFQVVEAYHKERMERLGVSDLYEIKGNAAVAMDFYAELLKEYQGDRVKALTAYNGGKGAVINGASTDYAEKVLARRDRIIREMELSGTHYTRFHFAEDDL